jgi:hypothetical protein
MKYKKPLRKKIQRMEAARDCEVREFRKIDFTVGRGENLMKIQKINHWRKTSAILLINGKHTHVQTY